MADDLPDESQRQLSPVGLYSHAADVAQRFPQMKGTPQQFRAMLMKQGVKPDEFKHSNYDEKFAGRPLVTKDELAQHFKASVPPVQETTLRDKPSELSVAQEQGGYWNVITPDGNVVGTRQSRADAEASIREYEKANNGAPKFHSYTLPGSTNYRETLLHLAPSKEVAFDPSKVRIERSRRSTTQGSVKLHYGDKEMGTFDDSHTINPATKQWEGKPDDYWRGVAERRFAGSRELRIKPMDEGQTYRSSHWDTPNVLAHLRMSDRKGPKGEKILHLEELQSDWAQEGRKKGFAGAAAFTPEERAEYNRRLLQTPHDDQSRQRLMELAEKERQQKQGVPSAPYVDSTQKWVDLGLKRLLHEAAKDGYDKIAVTPGEEQAKRYDLSKHIEDLTLHGAGDNMRLSATDKNGRKVIDMQHVTDKTLADHIGKEAAEKLLAQPEPNPKNPYAARNLFGAQLKVGGEGMKAFYDQMLPKALEKLAKKHDPEAKVWLHGHDFKHGKIVNPWHVLAVDPDGEGDESINQFHNEGSARGWARDQARRAGAPVDELYRVEHRGAAGAVKGHSLNITPKMRASILRGQPAFAAGGTVKPSRLSLGELKQIADRHGFNSPHYTRAYEAYSEPEPDEKLQKAAGGPVDHHPTEAQKEAGNYRKERISFQGLPVSIENKAGSTRHGVDAKGKPWSARLPADYGYVRGTEGADGDHVDCFIGPHRSSPLVVVVNQRDQQSGRFDEHKCMLGFNTERDAVDTYRRAFSDGHGGQRIGSVESMSMDAFKHWLRHGRTDVKAHGPSIVERALGVARAAQR